MRVEPLGGEHLPTGDPASWKVVLGDGGGAENRPREI